MSTAPPSSQAWGPPSTPTQEGSLGVVQAVIDRRTLVGSLGSSLGNPLPLSSNSYYRGIRQMVQVSDQDMNTHLAEISRVRKSLTYTH